MQKLSGLFLLAVLISGTLSSGFAFAQVGPIAQDDFYSIDEDAILTVNTNGVLFNDTNTNSTTFLAILDATTNFGTLDLNSNGTFTYQPNQNFALIDSFSYFANNGTHNSNNATVTISVNPINDAPVAVNDTAQTQQNVQTSIDVLENDSDVEDDSLNIILVVDPTVTKGTVELSNSTVLFTPQTDFVGVTSFSYMASDGDKTSNLANVTVNVVATPDDVIIEQLLAQIQSLLDKVLGLEDELILLQEENNALALRNAELEDIIANGTSTDDDNDDNDHKVIVCHKGKKSISISNNALPAHLQHGDIVGECDDDAEISPKNNFKNQIKELKHDFKIAQKELKNDFKSQEKELKKQFNELKKEKKSKDKHDENEDDDDDDDDYEDDD